MRWASAAGPLTRSATVQTVARAVGWVAIVLVAARIVFEPEDTRLAYGAFVALAAAALAWASTWVPRQAEPAEGARGDGRAGISAGS